MGNISLKFPTKSSYPYFKRKDYIPSWNFKWLLNFKSEKCFFQTAPSTLPLLEVIFPWATFSLDTGAVLGSFVPSGAVLILTHLPLYKIGAILQTSFSNVFSWMKSFVFWFEFRWSLFLRVQLTNVSIGSGLQVMAWNQTGNKPLSELMLTQFTDAYIWHKGRWVKLTLTLLRMHMCQFCLHHCIQNIPQILFHWDFIPKIKS